MITKIPDARDAAKATAENRALLEQERQKRLREEYERQEKALADHCAKTSAMADHLQEKLEHIIFEKIEEAITRGGYSVTHRIVSWNGHIHEGNLNYDGTMLAVEHIASKLREKEYVTTIKPEQHTYEREFEGVGKWYDDETTIDIDISWKRDPKSCGFSKIFHK